MENTYRVIAKARCNVCENTWIIDAQILAPQESGAVLTMKQEHKLCPSCLKTGTSSATTFENFINVERLPSSGIK
jgi:hypothetical protein